ncbi:MAG: hypothetical protein KDC49_14365 [Saprospiraceae bacterium]|nr:hypothetical protein [Saprospiraceae bacterium]
MMKFFRNIRQALLAEGKTSRYLKYAVGEIILVVIGILIALQVNNWNTEKNEQKTIRSLLEAIKQDLKTDIEQTNRTSAFNQKYLDFRKRMLIRTNFDDLPLDSLTFLLRKRTSLYTMNESAFNKLTSLGISKPSKNDSLNFKIFRYYTVIKEHSAQRNDWERSSEDQESQVFNKQAMVELDVKHFDLPEMMDIPSIQDTSTQRRNIIAALKSIEVRNMLKYEVFRKISLIKFFENRNEFAEGLILDIDKELRN